jgi:hypothetical protein
MSFEQAIKTIVDLNEEIKAVKLLMAYIESNTENLESENCKMSSCLRAIKKINREKNEAISALCEKE